MSTASVEETRRKYELVAKIAITVVAIALVAPFIFLLIKGALGVAAAVLISAIVIGFAPAASLSIANMGLALLKLEAGRNPVETLQNEYLQKLHQLEEKRLLIEVFVGKFKTFESKVAFFKKNYPEEAGQYDEQLLAMRGLIEQRKEKYQEAAGELKSFHAIVEKADATWQITEALKEASSGETASDEFYAEMRTSTALDSVQTSLNASFAALDTSLLVGNTEKKLLSNEREQLQ